MVSKMADGQASLRDLVETGAAKYPVAPRWLWEWALDAILRQVLLAKFPEGISLDTPFNHGGAWHKWRNVIGGALPAVGRGSDPSSWGWTSAIMLSPAAFHSWLKETLRERKITIYPRRAVGAKSTLREDVAAFIAANYPNSIPAGITNKKIAQDYKSKTRIVVSERTVRRARGRS